jgi:hypothetical protein
VADCEVDGRGPNRIGLPDARAVALTNGSSQKPPNSLFTPGDRAVG